MSSVIVIDMLLVVDAGGIRVEGGGAVNCSCFLM